MKKLKLLISIITLAFSSIYAAAEWPVVFTCKNNSAAHLTKVTNCKTGCNEIQKKNFGKIPDCTTSDNLLELKTLASMPTTRCINYYQPSNPASSPEAVCGIDNIDYVQILGDQKTSSSYELQPVKK